MAKDSGHRDRADRKIAKLMQYPKKKENPAIDRLFAACKTTESRDEKAVGKHRRG